MAENGKFVPGGAKKNPSSVPTEAIRAPVPPRATSLKPGGRQEALARNRKRRTYLYGGACIIVLLFSGWYYLQILPARKAAAIQAELAQRNKELEEIKKKEEEQKKISGAPLPSLSSLKVDTIPTGADVTIGAQTQKTPVEIKDLSAGSQSLKIEMPGYVPVEKDISLEQAKQLDLGIIRLVRKTGKLQLTSSSNKVEYTLTGPDHFTHSGSIKDSLDGLVEGDYTLVAKQGDWVLPPTSISVKYQQETVYDIKFPLSSIRLESEPSGATVRSGRAILGKTPFVLKDLRAGSRSFSFEMPNYKIAKIDVQLGEGENAEKSVKLDKNPDFTTSFDMIMIWVPEGYWVGKYEVSQRQYEKVMKNNPSFFRGLNRPVESVSWTEAVEFCKKATEKEREAGDLPDGYQFSLPTEGQWEYFLGDANIDTAVTSREEPLNSTADVGSSEPNQFGLYDVLGNVWEWCIDPFDPAGRLHVIRGGSWLSSNDNFPNSSIRNGAGENYRDKFTGFRCVLVKTSP